MMHVERTGECRAAKRVERAACPGQPTDRRPVDRPRYRWKNAVAKDLKQLNVPKSSELAQDRKKWRTWISEVKIHFVSLTQQSK